MINRFVDVVSKRPNSGNVFDGSKIVQHSSMIMIHYKLKIGHYLFGSMATSVGDLMRWRVNPVSINPNNQVSQFTLSEIPRAPARAWNSSSVGLSAPVQTRERNVREV